MTSFSRIDKDQLRTDCRFYTGYKPCHKNDGCPGCDEYRPRGEQLLVIKLGAMGDVLRTKAILPALKAAHPVSWIVWLTAPGSEVLARDPLVDEVRVLDTEGVFALRGRRFAKLLCLDKDAHAVRLSAELDAEQRYGFAPTLYNTITVWNEGAMEALRMGLSDELKFRLNRKPMQQIVAECCELPWAGDRYGLEISEEARRDAAAVWDSLGLPRGRQVVGLNTGCGPVFATKGWHADRMEEFLRDAAAREDVTMLLLGGRREETLHRHLMERAGPLAGRAVFDAGNRHSLEVFFALLERCALVVSADTLALHAAVALGRPVVGLFGPTSAAEVDLYGQGEKVVTDFSCAPCYLKKCPMGLPCMEALSAARVWGAAERVLAGRAGHAQPV